MTYNVLMGTLDPTHPLTHSLSHVIRKGIWSMWVCCSVNRQCVVCVEHVNGFIESLSLILWLIWFDIAARGMLYYTHDWTSVL